MPGHCKQKTRVPETASVTPEDRNRIPLVTLLREVVKVNSKTEAYSATAGLLVMQKAGRDRGLWLLVIIVPVGGDGITPNAGH